MPPHLPRLLSSREDVVGASPSRLTSATCRRPSPSRDSPCTQFIRRRRVDDAARDGALKRPCAIRWVVALVAQPGARRGAELERDLALGDGVSTTIAVGRTMASSWGGGEKVRRAIWGGRRADGARGGGGIEWRGSVRGHDQHGVAEVDRAALAVGEAPVVEHLEQDVEHVGVRLLDLVEQHDAVGPAAHRLGELAALVVADVARRERRSGGETVCFSMYSLMSMRTIVRSSSNRNSASAAPARSCRRRWGRGTGTSRSAGWGPAGRRALRRMASATATMASSWPTTRWRRRSSILQQALALALEHLVDRDAGPAGDDLGDVLVGDLLAQRGAVLLAALRARAARQSLARSFSSCGSSP